MLLIFTSAFTYENGENNFKFKLGANLAYIDNNNAYTISSDNSFGESVTKKHDTSPGMNLSLGIEYERSIAKDFCLSAELDYQSLNSILKLENLKSKYQSDILNVSICANYHPISTFSIGLGPSFIFPVNDLMISPENYSGTNHSIDEMKVIVPAFKVRLAYSFHQHYGTEFSYLHSFSSIVEEDNYCEEIFPKVFNIYLTYKF